ncbi:hypothetical protein [Nocardioides zhouii]|uniref:Glycosyltransferase RgtA/B/C/D-like domain-containing protein n=1 Tax=Nocardioides zhouii TaxID=1168729 RepID=A0A4Q2T1N2_9ACTN|nr:hypothetical protein [Nocardioides zhouii]RYC10854.1 hypothetical protein EUA94_11655 [Nocardioides zhouii]
MTFLSAAFATPYRRGVWMIAAVTLVWRGWTVARWSWQDDDWVYVSNAATMSLPDYMLQMYHGHFMPGEFLVMWIVTRLAPLDYGVPILLTAVASGAVVLLWGRALARVAGELRWVLVPLALLSLSPLFLRPTLWWASALQVVPLQACLAWGVLVAAGMARAPSRRATVHLVCVLVVALFFWEKAVLLVAPFAMVLVCAGGGRIVERVRRHLVTLAALGAVALAYVALYLFLGRGSTDQDELGVNLSSPPSVREALDFVWSGLGNLLAPATLGGPWGSMPGGSQPFSEAAPVVQVVTSLVLALSVLVLVVTRRQSWAPFTVAAAYVLVSWALVLFSSRFVNLGSLAVNDERYTVDAFSVVVLAFVLALTRPRRDRIGLPERLPVSGRAVLVGLAGVSLVSLAVGNVLAVHRIGTHPGRLWTENLRSEILRVPDESPVVLWDGYAPQTVLQTGFWNEWALLSRMLRPLDDRVAFREPADQIYQPDEDGMLQPIGISRLSTSTAGSDDGCGYYVEPGRPASVPMSAALFHWGWGLELTAYSDTGGTLLVELGSTDVELTLPSGMQTRAVQFDGEVADTVLMSMPDDAEGSVCVTDVHVGEPEPRAG